LISEWDYIISVIISSRR